MELIGVNEDKSKQTTVDYRGSYDSNEKISMTEWCPYLSSLIYRG